MFEHLYKVATILGVAVALLTLVFGFVTYYRDVQSRNESRAVSALQEHWRLSVEYPDLATPTTPPQVSHTEEYSWFASHAMFTADTAYDLSGGEPNFLDIAFSWLPPRDAEIQETHQAWNNTVAGMIENHRAYMVSDRFKCVEHEQEFVEFVEDTLGEAKLCENAGGNPN